MIGALAKQNAELPLDIPQAAPRSVGVPILPGLPPRLVMDRRLADLEARAQHEDQGRCLSDGEAEELHWLREYLAKPKRAA